MLSVWDLLHGLMLPSGNDAATVLAEHFGQYLFEVATRYKNSKQGGGQGANPNSNPGGAGGQANASQPTVGVAGGAQATGGDADNQRRMQSD